MTQAANVLFLHAQTPVHPGSGTALGAVDLPVQRERHTHWPVIPGTSLKGVLRDVCRPREDNGQHGNEWLAVFGPETQEAAEHAGALSVTDARILAFPVRSLNGVFAWVTCPSALERLRRDLRIAGLEPPELATIPQPQPQHVLCAGDSPLLIRGKTVVLEEFDFTHGGEIGDLAGWLAASAVSDTYTRDRLKQHLAVLPDNDFTHFVRHATEVSARIGLDYERKTVKKGALFYQEFLPAETLLYALQMASSSRRPELKVGAAEILAWVESRLQQLNSVLQLGGDETTGKGLCLLQIVKGS